MLCLALLVQGSLCSYTSCFTELQQTLPLSTSELDEVLDHLQAALQSGSSVVVGGSSLAPEQLEALFASALRTEEKGLNRAVFKRLVNALARLSARLLRSVLRTIERAVQAQYVQAQYGSSLAK